MISIIFFLIFWTIPLQIASVYGCMCFFTDIPIEMQTFTGYLLTTLASIFLIFFHLFIGLLPVSLCVAEREKQRWLDNERDYDDWGGFPSTPTKAVRGGLSLDDTCRGGLSLE